MYKRQILDETLAQEKHHLYQIILASFGKIEEAPWSEMELHVGRRLIEKAHPLLPDHLEKQKKKWQNILDRCREKDLEATKERWKQAKDMLDALRGVKERDHLRRCFKDH